MVVKGFGTVNKNEQVGEKGFNRNLYIFVAVVIGIFLAAAFVSSNIPLTKTVTNVKTTTEATTGAATSSQVNNAGQETIIGSKIGWLPITGEPLDIELTGYESVVRVYVYANGKIDAELRDENLVKQQKAVGVKILLKNENNKIYETGQLTLGRIAMSSFIGDWKTVTGIENPTKLKWQPQFTIVDRELPQKSVKKVAT